MNGEPSATSQAPRADPEPCAAGRAGCFGPRGASPRVLIVDNYDSFTYNLVQYLGELGADVEVIRNDVEELLERDPDRVIVSPGPCSPNEAGLSMRAVRRFGERGTPVLGVCLGHQSLAQEFGGRVVRGEPVHGKTAEMEHDGRTIYAGLESPLVVGRYHSLVVDPDTLPDALEVSAQAGDVIMGLRHRELPVEGVQFHPESVLTPQGKQMLRNFLSGEHPATARGAAAGGHPASGGAGGAGS